MLCREGCERTGRSFVLDGGTWTKLGSGLSCLLYKEEMEEISLGKVGSGWHVVVSERGRKDRTWLEAAREVGER